MIVHFSASIRTLEVNLELYRTIITTIRGHGCSISNDWVEAAWLYLQNTSQDKLKRDWQQFCQTAEASIEGSDVVVVEGSGFGGFEVGYETCYAVKNKKPTLILIEASQIASSYAAGLKGDGVTIKSYTTSSLEKTIKIFLRDNNMTNMDLRFNFAIDRQIYNHLRRKSFSTGKTKAEIVRDVVLRDINERGL